MDIWNIDKSKVTKYEAIFPIYIAFAITPFFCKGILFLHPNKRRFRAFNIILSKIYSYRYSEVVKRIYLGYILKLYLNPSVTAFIMSLSTCAKERTQLTFINWQLSKHFQWATVNTQLAARRYQLPACRINNFIQSISYYFYYVIIQTLCKVASQNMS